MNHYSFFYIKVLHGVNKGAEANFSKDSISIGSSDDCDLILSGFSSVEKRVVIDLHEDKCLIKAVNQPFHLDGVKVYLSDGFVPFKLYQIIDVDGCRLAVCKKGEALPQGLDQIIYPTQEDDAAKSSTSLLPGFMKYQGSKNITDTQKIMLGAAGLMVVGAVVLANLKSPVPSDLVDANAVALNKLSLAGESPAPLTNPVEDKQALLNVPQKSLESSRDELTLSAAAVIQSDQSSALLSNPEEIKNAEKEAYLLLRVYGVNRIKLHLDGAGLLSAKGYVGDDKNWEKAKTSILGDIDGINQIDDKDIETFTTRAISLNKLLQDNRLKGSILVDADTKKNTIVISGELTRSDIQQWKILKTKFLRENGGEPSIEEKIVDIEKNLRLSIRGVSIGQTRYFVSEAGKKYMVGSDLGNGYRVLAIEMDKITLLYKRKKISVFYNQLINNNPKDSIRS